MYKLLKNTNNENIIVKDNMDGTTTSFLENADNTDYQAYLAWVALGNQPQPADEGVTP